MASSKCKVLISLAAALSLCLSMVGAQACTSIYLGSALTEDGSTIFGRSEDIANSYNKLFYVSPAGNHSAGEVYDGCYGFSYTFTRDSYSYTAFRDDNGDGVDGVCPDCGGTHKHTPYEAGGTNEMGLSVSATETIGASEAVSAVDPYKDAGIEEAEIVTVLLSEAATAREAVDLLLRIYDESGCCGGSGLFIADANETWYVENTTGSQYIALKLSDNLAFAQPNMSVIGLIDLDDSENVIASEKLIAVAQEAGSFVGDAEANTIDYVASYNADQSANERMANALKFFGAEIADAPAAADYTISNVDAEGNIVPFYTNIALDHAYTIEDVVKFYDIDGIASTRNLETHVFQIFPEGGARGTVEWIAMDDAGWSVFVPYYPMLTTDTYAGYQLSTAAAVFSEEEPVDGLYYATTATQYTDEGRVSVEGFRTLPENWADSMYWSADALSNLVTSAELSEDKIAEIEAGLAGLQQQCYDAYAELQAAVAAAESDEAAAEAATKISADAAAAVHAGIVEMVNSIQ